MEHQGKYQEMQGSRSASDGESPYPSKGLSLGKIILMAGLVFSCAPVVLPAVLVISALVFACSVPYGLFLATYSFTETLMTKLLPLQAHNPPEGDESGVMYGQKSRNELIEDETAEEEEDEVRSVVVEEGRGQEKSGSLGTEENQAEAGRSEDEEVHADRDSAGSEKGPIDDTTADEAGSGDTASPQSVAEPEGGEDASVAPTESSRKAKKKPQTKTAKKQPRGT